jgi:hypothetical protein
MDMDREMENDREMAMDMNRERAIYVRCDGRI